MVKPHLSIPGGGHVLVLNEMVLVIESLVHSITSTSTVLLTEHEQELRSFYDTGAEECG